MPVLRDLGSSVKVPARVLGLKKRLVMQDMERCWGFYFFLGAFAKAGCFSVCVRAKRGCLASAGVLAGVGL